MKTKAVKHCATCGAKVVEYKHLLNKGLVRGLQKLLEAGVEARHLNELNLTYNERCNFQKLRYWSLVHMYFQEGHHVAGYWQITAKGRWFAQGKVQVPKYVWTFRGEAVRFEDQMTWVWEVDELYKQRFEYAEEAMPDSQMSLLELAE